MGVGIDKLVFLVMTISSSLENFKLGVQNPKGFPDRIQSLSDSPTDPDMVVVTLVVTYFI